MYKWDNNRFNFIIQSFSYNSMEKFCKYNNNMCPTPFKSIILKISNNLELSIFLFTFKKEKRFLKIYLLIIIIIKIFHYFY